MIPANLYDRINKILVLVCIALGVITVGIIAFSFYTKQNTGLVTVKTFSSSAVVSVTQVNKNAAIAATGKVVKIRLKPGVYQIAASDNSIYQTKRITVTKAQNFQVDLTSKRPEIPAPDNINFDNASYLYNYGFTAERINNLELLFFRYNHDAEKVSIVLNTIENGERNSDDDEAPFTLEFSGSIDSKKYDAIAAYGPVDLDNVTLTLKDPDTGTVFYTGTTIESVTN